MAVRRRHASMLASASGARKGRLRAGFSNGVCAAALRRQHDSHRDRAHHEADHGQRRERLAEDDRPRHRGRRCNGEQQRIEFGDTDAPDQPPVEAVGEKRRNGGGEGRHRPELGCSGRRCVSRDECDDRQRRDDHDHVDGESGENRQIVRVAPVDERGGDQAEHRQHGQGVGGRRGARLQLRPDDQRDSDDTETQTEPRGATYAESQNRPDQRRDHERLCGVDQCRRSGADSGGDRRVDEDHVAQLGERADGRLPPQLRHLQPAESAGCDAHREQHRGEEDIAPEQQRPHRAVDRGDLRCDEARTPGENEHDRGADGERTAK